MCPQTSIVGNEPVITGSQGVVTVFGESISLNGGVTRQQLERTLGRYLHKLLWYCLSYSHMIKLVIDLEAAGWLLTESTIRATLAQKSEAKLLSGLIILDRRPVQLEIRRLTAEEAPFFFCFRPTGNRELEWLTEPASHSHE